MIHSNQRIFKKLQKDTNQKVKKKIHFKELRNKTKSIRMKFWSSNKKLFLALDNGIVETISKSDEGSSLSRLNFMDIRDQIISMSYIYLNTVKDMKNPKNIWTIQCPTSVWIINLGSKKIIGGGRLDKRLNRNERITGVYSVHEGRILCVLTNQSRALLMLIRQNNSKIELVFLDILTLAIGNITGHEKFGKYIYIQN